MKIFDMSKLAIKAVRSRWTALSLLGITVAVFCMCFSGAILMTVKEEKAQPYELKVSAEGGVNIGDHIITDILEFADVTAATCVLQAPVTIQTDKYTAQLTLTGLDAGYLDSAFAQGGMFPADSVMPYILLNKAACKQFAEEDTDAGTEAPDIAWLDASCSLSTDESGRSVMSKVCGLLLDGDDTAEPAAYVSLSVVKGLLRQSGQPTEVKTVWVRITNIGCADVVSKQIALLGLNVTNFNEQMQEEWDTQINEMVYLLVVVAFCLACAAFMFAASRTIMLEQQRGAFELLRWIGMRDRDMSRMFMLHALIVSMLGAAIGIIVSLSLPSFLPPKLKGLSCYMLPIPFAVIIVSMIICAFFGVISVCVPKKHRPQF